MIEERNEDLTKSRRFNQVFKMFGNIVFTIFMIIMIILIFLTAQSRINGREPGLFGYRFYIVESGSMSPTIKTDSMIIIKEQEPKAIVKGDIITYYGHGDSRITHRVMEVDNNGDSFITRGDANNSNDPIPLEGRKLIGKVTFIIPFLGNIFRFLGTKLGIALLITLSIVWIALPKLLSKESR